MSGPTAPWGVAGSIAVALCVVAGLWLRLHLLAAEGFADDEVHKWLAAHRYLGGVFTGDDLEHPMLMKSLIALCVALLPPAWAPETLTRLPNALAGGLSVWAVAQLGRRLFDRATGLLAAALAAVCATFVGYQRVAKEDTLAGLFLLLLLWCVAEAFAAGGDARIKGRRRWELWGACALGAMFASKYYFFFVPIPVLAWLWLRQGGRSWPLPLRRWAQLAGVAFVVWAALNWTPFLPAAWPYLRDHLAGKHVETPSLLFMGQLYENVPLRLADGVPPSFFFVLAAVKLSPPVFLAALAGIAIAIARRRPAHRVMLVWAGFWYLVWLFSGGKYARYFIPVLPAFLLFASHALVVCSATVARSCTNRLALLAQPLRRAVAPLTLVLVATPVAAAPLLIASEAHQTLSLAPHDRLYISPLAGGRHGPEWFFPHCDYFDAGLRETIAWLAPRAEPSAEISSEAVLPASFYASRFGRGDLLTTRTRKSESCRAGRVCYVIVQVGRLYLHNQDAVNLLSGREPVHVETILGRPVLHVYRLEAGESPFPGGAATARGDPRRVVR